MSRPPVTHRIVNIDWSHERTVDFAVYISVNSEKNNLFPAAAAAVSL